MKSSVLLACLALLSPLYVYSAPATSFSFGVISKPQKAIAGEAMVRNAIIKSDADNLAFVVANGIKAGDEPCTDAVYKKRRALFNSAQNGLIVSITASDWAQCTNTKNRSIATERLSRVRDLFFSDEFSFGASKIPVIRQSLIPQFHMYAENMHWRIDDVIFATIDLPSNNNNYLNAAGRNSEFEDRQIANADWLKRIFLTAKISKLDGIVLFCDGNPFAPLKHASASGNKREGYAAIRRQIMEFSANYPGRILLVHSDYQLRSDPASKGIRWHENIGTLHIDAPWRKITVDTAQPQLFSLAQSTLPLQAARQ